MCDTVAESPIGNYTYPICPIIISLFKCLPKLIIWYVTTKSIIHFRVLTLELPTMLTMPRDSPMLLVFSTFKICWSCYSVALSIKCINWSYESMWFLYILSLTIVFSVYTTCWSSYVTLMHLQLYTPTQLALTSGPSFLLMKFLDKNL